MTLRVDSFLNCESFFWSKFLITRFRSWNCKVRSVDHPSHWFWTEVVLVTVIIPYNPELKLLIYFINNLSHSSQRMSSNGYAHFEYIIVDILLNWNQVAGNILTVVVCMWKSSKGRTICLRIQFPLVSNWKPKSGIQCLGTLLEWTIECAVVANHYWHLTVRLVQQRMSLL